MFSAGLVAYDVHNHLQCRFDAAHSACKEPVYNQQVDKVFSMVKPLVARPDIIVAALKENFGAHADLVQVSPFLAKLHVCPSHMLELSTFSLCVSL
jgi:hypothetical protein